MTNDLGMNIFSGENHKMIGGNYGALFPPKGFELTLSLPWPRKNFSLQCLYIEKQTSDENKEKCHQRISSWSNTKFSNLAS